MSRDYSYYPLTYPQQNIFNTEVAFPNTTLGIITATMRIVDDDLDLKLAEKAINLIIQHNDSLRARIKMIDREPRQYFVEYEYEKLDIIDLTNSPIEELYKYDKEQTAIPFNLIRNKLYKFTLIKISDNEFAVFLKIHHLISDGWSTVRIGNYILDYYEKLQRGININFDKIPSFNEYILTEAQYLSSELYKKDKEYWLKKFEDVPEPSMIKPRKSNLVNIEAKRRTFVLPDRLIAQLRKYCKDTRTSIFAVILSAFAIYLNRTTHKDSVSIGTLVLNRASRRQKNTVGMFISTVPICISFENTINFTEFNKMLTREWMSVLKHQRYPFDHMLKDVREKHKGVKDLFDIVFSYQNASFTENESSKQHTSRWHFNAAQKESLTIHIHDRDDMGKLLLDYDYLTDLFYEKEIEFIHDNFIRILWHALDNPRRPMSNLELIAESEKQRILYDFNSKTVDYDNKKSIVDFISEQVKRTPDKVALIHSDKCMTYKQLDDKSNALANVLISEGIKTDEIVCLLIDKSIDMIVAILSVLKAGSAYLAIENELPSERKRYLFEDSKSKILLTNKNLSNNLHFDGKKIYLEDNNNYLDTTRRKVDINTSDLAYVIYTSGTTGQPKGVMIEHKSVVNYVHGFLDEFKYTGDEVVLEQASYSFDAFVEEVYPTLFTGGTLVIADKYGAKDMKKISEAIIKNKITVVSVSPLVLNELNKMNCFDSIKLYISGGDVLKYEYMDNLIDNSTVYNTYGPTEATVCATYHKCDKVVKDNIPIGKPVANYKLYILDRNLNLLPIGVSGDLYISGLGLARGYLNRPDLTKEVFIDNPFSHGEKMYKTNDIARWYPMGEIGYLGRADRQVKIRGIRIELGEIENRLLKHEKIKSVVVLDRVNSEGKKLLCAYYEAKEYISIQEIRDYLRHDLPNYMIPSYFLQMDKIPLSASGKVNINALPDLKNMILNEQNEYVAPSNDIEKRLVSIVEKLLKVDKVGMNDNYFDLGGDSLSITTLTYDIIDEFDVDIPLERLFRADTLKEISDIIAGSTKVKVESKDRNLILMHKGVDKNKNIFFVHDGIGGIGAYFDLCNNLDEYNIWGIRAEDNEGIAPKDLTIEEIAKSYVEQIVNVADEPYSIAGWCIGGTIAYEIIKQLEERSLRVNTLFIIDSIPPIMWRNEKRFTLDSEKLFIYENLKYNENIKISKEIVDIDTLWQNIVNVIDYSIFKDEIIKDFMSRIPTDIRQYMDDYHNSSTRDIFTFVNQVRTYHIARVFYHPKHKIKADICYLGAKENSVVKDSKLWGDYTLGKVIYSTVEGDHNTMLKLPGTKYIADKIKEHIK